MELLVELNRQTFLPGELVYCIVSLSPTRAGSSSSSKAPFFWVCAEVVGVLTPCSGRTKLSAELSEEAKRVVGGGSGFAAPEGSLRVLGEKKEEKEEKERRRE